MTVTHFEVPTANGAFRLARIAFVQSGPAEGRARSLTDSVRAAVADNQH